MGRACFWTVSGNRKPTQVLREHFNSALQEFKVSDLSYFPLQTGCLSPTNQTFSELHNRQGKGGGGGS